jgi:hypothetical protein
VRGVTDLPPLTFVRTRPTPRKADRRNTTYSRRQ